MTIEAATNIATLNPLYPATGDSRTEGDDHIRLVKTVLQTLPVSGGAAQIGYINSGAGTFLRNVQDRLRDIVSVKDFKNSDLTQVLCDSDALGSVGQDAVTGVQAALTAVGANGAALYVPGFIKISAALNITKSGTRIYGAGRGNSGFITTSITADVFTCSAGLANVEFHDFYVWSTVTKTAGNVFTCPTAARYVFDNLVVGDRSTVASLGNRFYRIIDLQGCDDSIVTGCQLSGYSLEGIRAYGVGAYSSELHIGGGTRISSGGIGVHIAGNFGGAYFGEVAIDLNVKNIVIDQSASATINREIFLGPDTVLDVCSDTGLEVGTNACSSLTLTGTWIASAGRYGTPSGNQTNCNVLPTNAALIFKATGVRFFNATGNGLVINGCAHAQLTGNCYDSNVGVGLYFPNSAIGSINSVGGKSTSNGTGLQIAPGVLTFNFDGLDLIGNTTAVSNGAGLGATKTIRNSPGYATASYGGGSIGVAASSLAITHGLAVTPGFNNIVISPTSNPASSSVVNTWVSAVGATTFTVSTNAAVAVTPLTLSWSANVAAG